MFKRFSDIFFSSILMIILFIPMLIICLIIKISSSGKVFFYSERFGKYSKKFFMIKFRTMEDNAPNVATHLLTKPNKYLFPFGIFLRKTGLDELPQLWNIFKGDMTFVGPRPALFNQFELMKMRRLYNIDKLKPGVTGWAQINGRDDNDYKSKIDLEKYYYENRNFLIDLKIIIITIVKIFKTDDVSH